MATTGGSGKGRAVRDEVSAMLAQFQQALDEASVKLATVEGANAELTKRLAEVTAESEALRMRLASASPDPDATTLEGIREAQRRLEGKLLRAALEKGGWLIVQTAEILGCGPSMVRGLLAKHPEIDDERRLRRASVHDGHRGRPVLPREA